MKRLMGAFAVLSLVVSVASASAEERLPWPDLRVSGPTQGGGDKDAAVIVGIDRYAFVAPVPGAEENARDWFVYLRKMRGVPGENIRLLVGKEATKEEVQAKVAEAARAVGPGGTLWFVFIGHGLPSEDGKDGLLVGVDAQEVISSLGPRSLSRRGLIASLKRGRQTRTVVVLDTCFSGKTATGDQVVAGLQATVPVPSNDLERSEAVVFTS